MALLPQPATTKIAAIATHVLTTRKDPRRASGEVVVPAEVVVEDVGPEEVLVRHPPRGPGPGLYSKPAAAEANRCGGAPGPELVAGAEPGAPRPLSDVPLPVGRQALVEVLRLVGAGHDSTAHPPNQL